MQKFEEKRTRLATATLALSLLIGSMIIEMTGGEILSVDSATRCPTTYTVKSGDTLRLIAYHYNQLGYSVTWQQIAKANHITSPYTVSAGQVLIIPLTCKTTTTTSTTSTIATTTSSYITTTTTSSITMTSTSTSSITSTSRASTTQTNTNSTQTSSNFTSSEDYQLWVLPYLSQLENIRAVLMQSYSIGRGHYGYDSSFGLVRGGNIQANPAINVSNGYHDVIVAINNNLEGSYSLDYFNSANSVLLGQPGFTPQATNIYGNDRALLSKTWDGIGNCSSPFVQYTYPSSFSLFDRREAEYGFIGPYASIVASPGNHLGGIGSPSCTNGTVSATGGQVWFLQGYENPQTTLSQPLIATVFPSSYTIASRGDLESLSFYIDQMYMQCQAGIPSSCTSWRTAYLNAMSQYPFPAPREALHFVQVTRATGAWQDPTFTYNGTTATQMLQNTITKLFTPAVSGGSLGPDGGLYQSWGGIGSSDTPEPNFQAMVAFDPRMPSWFVNP